MSNLISAETGSTTKEMDLRNRAYTYLKEAVDEIRDCGKYAMADNKDRLKGYRSEFLHKLNRQYHDGEESNIKNE